MATLTGPADAEAKKVVTEYDAKIRKFAEALADQRGASEATDQEVRDSVNEYLRRKQARKWGAYLTLTGVSALGSAIAGIAFSSMGATTPIITGTPIQISVAACAICAVALAEAAKTKYS
jgi:hypothetical protein